MGSKERSYFVDLIHLAMLLRGEEKHVVHHCMRAGAYIRIAATQLRVSVAAEDTSVVW